MFLLAYLWGNNAEALKPAPGAPRITPDKTGQRRSHWDTVHNPRRNRRRWGGNPQKRSSSSCGRGLDLESQKKTQTQLSFNFPSALDTAEALPQLSRSKKPPAQRVSWRREGPRTCVALAPLKSSDQLARSRARSPSSCGTMMTPRGGCGGQGLSAVGGGRWH